MEPDSESTIDDFAPVQDGWQLLPVLRERLPRASNIYNMAIMHPSFLSEMKIYTLNRDTSLDCWIVIVFTREDYGRDINISGPTAELEHPISDAIKNAFTNSKLFTWEAPYFFSALERPVANMILEISCRLKGNQTTVNPCVVYYAGHDFNETEGGVDLVNSLRSLNSAHGVNFIQANFKYSKPQTRVYVEKIIERNPSVGLFIGPDLQPRSGAVTTGNGFIGMLYTEPTYRNRNFATIVMRELVTNLLEANFSPCSVVERSNHVSRRFHEKIGMKYSHDVEFVFCTT